MLVKNQYVEVAWHSQSKDHYIKKGYHFTKYKEKFFVKAEDLSKSSTAEVRVICDYCGKEYQIKWYHYKLDVIDKNSDCCCYNCRHTKRYRYNIEYRQNNLYKRAIERSNKSEYQFVSKRADITNNTSIIDYLCPIHGLQKMRINNFISGEGCPECNKESSRKRYRLREDEVKNRITQYGSTLLNSNEYINQDCKNLKVVCPACGATFLTSLSNFTQHEGQLCKICSHNESKGETKIRTFLELNSIDFVQEKWFSDCRDKKPLPFDFYLPDYNMCIEFDGEQHYIDKGSFNTSLEYVRHHDRIKSAYCDVKGIVLLRIPYWDYSNIEIILSKILISHKDIV